MVPDQDLPDGPLLGMIIRPFKYSAVVGASDLAGARLKRLENQSVIDSLNLLAKGQGDEAVGFAGFSQDVAPHGQNGHGGQPAFAACPSEGQRLC